MRYKLFVVILCLLPMMGLGRPETFKNGISSVSVKTTFSIRGGLPNFFSKIEKGDTIRVAYLGGSITAQQGWRVYSLEWFKRRFPDAHFIGIDAAIGGTGSDFGVFRLEEQVLSRKPDLLFVEFAVNDSGTPDERIIRSMEGIIRQTWQNNPSADICFIYTIKESFLDMIRNGKLPSSVQTMEKVADHYHIPSINFGRRVFDLMDQKKLIFRGDSEQIGGTEVFSPDGVHPFPGTGHKIYQEVLKDAFETMSLSSKQKKYSHKLYAPLDNHSFFVPRMVNGEKAYISGSWESVETDNNVDFHDFNPLIKSILKISENGILTLRFKGTAIGFYDMVGPGAGWLEVVIDGSRKDTIKRFDEYCTYWRINYFLIDDLKDTEHRMIVRVLPETLDKAVILAKRNDVISNPAEFAEQSWYLVKILVNGSLIVP